ncbi:MULTISPECIES: sigma-54-dependent Fis family transcriptional regulator [unclassified Thioalkalivibrio]|uniref:sigma-54-dependent Fis family transcriptional regulator n=1 Tax=unclassified Thioalkalivibrio TaxID=2621013 RepID=UPI00037D4533|nr:MULTISPECIES: sigma-54-dependent Fis family transcriptional regulator [unclassified Thioalkalivibrio]
MTDMSRETHSRSILDAVSGAPGWENSTDNHILASWKRCLSEYQLDPDAAPEPRFVSDGDLRHRREESRTLVEIAQEEMTNLYQQVAGTGYSILLTDSDGVLLKYVGDPIFTDAAASTGLQAGAIWHEQYQGTNGIGTCLVEQRPLVIHKNDHFFGKNIRLTCSAAPVFDPTGRVCAVLDASSESRMAQQHTMVLVNMSAQLIENRLFLCGMRDHYLLRFHSRPEFVNTLGEGIVAFDPAGRILAANRSALFQLNENPSDRIVGELLRDVFNIRVDTALQYARSPVTQPVPLHDSRQGRRFYVSFQPPASPPAANLPSSRAEHAKVPAPQYAMEDLHWGDTRMNHNIEQARKLLDKDLPFMLLGETGSGKDVFARAIHLSSARHREPFIAVNCASLPETLIESELFGYRPGAFTGASREGSRGKIVQADGGTLFLDEIGDMPLALQARLLRVLEEREVVPLGSETSVRVDIRVISATHQDLQQQVAEGRFRQDLFYRLRGISLTIPPLRERQDRRELIQRLLEIEAGDSEAVSLVPDALAILDSYPWPGNIRELRSVLRTLVGLSEDGIIRAESLPEFTLQNNPELETQAADLSNPLTLAERETLLRELEGCHWNVSQVAANLDVSRNTLYRKMKRCGIKPPR